MITEIKGITLYFDGCDTAALAKKYGTPLYVYSETDIVSRFAQLRETFLDRYENTRVAYAAKAFCTPAMLRLCDREGMCVDVVSGGELSAAIAAGFPPERIEFNGNNKLPSELELPWTTASGASSSTGCRSWASSRTSARPRASG